MRKKLLVLLLAPVLFLLPFSSVSAASVNETPPSDGVLIKFAPGADRAKVWSQLRISDADRLKGDPSIIQADVPGDDRVVAERAEGLPGVLRATPNVLLEVTADAPDDPLFSSQWYLRNTGPGQFPGGNLSGEDVRALNAWDESMGDGAIVALIDSGVDTDHQDLKGQMWVNPDPFGDPAYPGAVHGWNFEHNSPDIRADSTHGTMMAGIIAAEANNGVGVTGVAPQARIMGLKAGSGNSVYVARAIEAAHFAGSRGAQIVNMSFASGNLPEYWWDDVMSSYPDMLFVHSAGNESTNVDVYAGDFFPCESDRPNSICVASTTNGGQLSSFSNYGSKVEVGAPGSHIYSTEPNNTYNWSAGTSQATALTSGVAALIQGGSPRASGSFMRDKLIEGGVSRPALNGITTTGKRVHAYNSVLLTDRVAPNTTISPVVSPVAMSSTVTYQMSKPSSANRFECSLNGAAFERCDGGDTMIDVSTVGPHQFRVRAIDDAGNIDPTPASVTFTADVTPPETTIVSKPNRYTNSQTATFSFTSEPAASFKCRVDSNPWVSCVSPHTVNGLPEGEHTFQVYSTDQAGNPDPTPASHQWEIILTVPETNAGGPHFEGDGRDVRFTMYSAEANRTGWYECRLTPPGSWETCVNPTVYRLTPGDYTFEVRGVNGAGVPDPTPWSTSFTVTGGTVDPPDPGSPGAATVTQGNIIDKTAVFRFDVTGNTDLVKCVLKRDGSVVQDTVCVSSILYENLTPGNYTFTVIPYLNGTAGTSDTVMFLIEKPAGNGNNNGNNGNNGEGNGGGTTPPPPPPPTVNPIIKVKGRAAPRKRAVVLPVHIRNPNRTAVNYKTCSPTLKKRVATGACVTRKVPGKTRRTFNIRIKGLKKGTFKLRVNIFFNNKRITRQVNIRVR